MTQTVTTISDVNIVPVGTDLTKEELRLSVIRGLEHMKRVDVPLGSGVQLGLGEWGVVGADGNVARPTSTPVVNSFLCFAGTNRFDTFATGKVTLIMNSLVIAKTTNYKVDDTLAPGDPLTAVLIASGPSTGIAGLRLRAGSEPIHARVVGVAAGVLTFSTNVP